MPTILSHTAVPVAAAIAGRGRVSRRLLAAGMVASMLPDIDVVGFFLGVPYAHPLGHRGFTHSLAFAALVAILGTWRADNLRSPRPLAAAFLFVATASHGLFDAMTTGGLGIAFFSPLSNVRYFLPWRPIAVSPIGVHGLAERGLAILVTEAVVMWLPLLSLGIIVCFVSRWRRLHRTRTEDRESSSA